MRKTCLFCGQPLNPPRKIFCSRPCIKHSWYLRHNPGAKSYYNKSPDFWKTETGIAVYWERKSAQLLGARHNLFGAGADLDWNGKTVDVKVCQLYRRKLKRGKAVKSQQQGVWVFNRNKLKPIDFFLCWCLQGEAIKKLLLIPADQFARAGITVGLYSKYDKYKLPPNLGGRTNHLRYFTTKSRRKTKTPNPPA